MQLVSIIFQDATGATAGGEVWADHVEWNAREGDLALVTDLSGKKLLDGLRDEAFQAVGALFSCRQDWHFADGRWTPSPSRMRVTWWLGGVGRQNPDVAVRVLVDGREVMNLPAPRKEVAA